MPATPLTEHARSRPSRRLPALASVAVALASLGPAVSAAHAAAPVTFASTGAEQSYTVPAGVFSLHVIATGGTGGAGNGNQSGGEGAVVTGNLSVTPGTTLYVEVGANGGRTSSAASFGGGGGGNSGSGAGGGASDVRTISQAGAGSLASRLLVAAGGGGGGIFAGNGGNADANGALGGDGTTAGGSTPGLGASATAGGAGGTGCSGGGAGGTGSLGSGGAGGAYDSGGGGGGLYGGGGGGGAPGGCGSSAGGAGSSYGPSGATFAQDSTATPSITITPISAPSAAITAPAPGQTYAVGQSVAAAFTCAEGTGGTGLSACADSVGTAGSGSTTSRQGSDVLDTATPGTHTFTATATSGDGLHASATLSYTVAAAPTATIATPAAGGTYRIGQAVATSFTCADGTDGPGIATCVDSAGASAGKGNLPTTTLGTHTYAVTATSRDGQRATTTMTYTVAPPLLSGVGVTHRSTVTWCGGCHYPKTQLRFTLAHPAAVRLALRARRHGRWQTVATTIVHGHAGRNALRLAGRWGGQLLLRRRVQILVQLRAGARWRTHSTLHISVASPYVTRVSRRRS